MTWQHVLKILNLKDHQRRERKAEQTEKESRNPSDVIEQKNNQNVEYRSIDFPVKAFEVIKQ